MRTAAFDVMSTAEVAFAGLAFAATAEVAFECNPGWAMELKGTTLDVVAVLA